jgi:transcriptional regulator with PAS, ATPase and Fis domain
LISATHQILEDRIKEGTFREDLYYRINVFPIDLRPLRERREDIRDLAGYFLTKAGREAQDLSDEAMRKLLLYNWPGNVRELRNVLERCLIVRPSGPITGEDILLHSVRAHTDEGEPNDALNLEAMEKHLILKALNLTQGNKSEAARLLGITRRALYGRLERYGIDE